MTPLVLAVGLALLRAVAALNSIAYTVALLPSDPMLMYNPGRGRWGDSSSGGWNLTYDQLNWATYEPGQEWSDKTRFALSPGGGEVRVPLSGVRFSVEGTSPDNTQCDVTATIGESTEKDTFKKGDMSTLQTKQQPFAFYTGRVQPACKNLAVVGATFDTLVNVTQKSVEAASYSTQTLIGNDDKLTGGFQQSGNVGIATNNGSSVASVPNLGWVAFKAPQYASLITIRGISCWNCSQFVVQMDPRPDGMDDKLLLDSYSPFTGPATMFVTPLDPRKEYHFNLTGIHGSGGSDSLLLKDVQFVVSGNPKSSPVGVIVGAVVGVVGGLAVIGAALWFFLRRRKSDKLTNMNDGSVVDLTHGQIAQVYPSYGSRSGAGPASSVALGEMHQPEFHPPPTMPAAAHFADAGAAPLSPHSPHSPHSTAPFASPLQSPFYEYSQPSSPDQGHPSTDIPRAQINDLDDYFQARDSYIEAEWEEAEAEGDAPPELGELDEERKGEPSRPPPRPVPVTQEQDAGRLVAFPRPQSAALPEYRPSSQYIHHADGIPEVSPQPPHP